MQRVVDDSASHGTIDGVSLQYDYITARRKGADMQTTTEADNLLTIDQLAERLNVHPVTARGLWRRRVIPGIRLGHRTLRFEYGAVLDALKAAGDPSVDSAHA